MLEVFNWFILGIINYSIDCFIFSQLVNKKFKLNLKLIVMIVIFSTINCWINYNYPMDLRAIISNIETCVLLKTVYGESLEKSLIASLFMFIVFAVSEAIFAYSIAPLLELNLNALLNNSPIVIFANTIITLISFLILNNRAIKTFLRSILDSYKSNKIRHTIVLFVIAIISIIAIAYPLIVEKHSPNQTILYGIFFIGVTVFVMGFFTQKSKTDRISSEYDYLLDHVKVYEKALSEKVKQQHEYKNQLIIIKSLLKRCDIKAQKYIDELIDQGETEPTVDLIEKIKNIPTGGLKGLIGYKLETMLEKNIIVSVIVDSRLEDKKYWKTCDKELKDISRALGVYLDNAIEAATNSLKPMITIDIYLINDNLVFEISNTYNGPIDFSRLDKERYSTKGKSRGYGLSLVKDILNKNSYLSQEREISGMFYVQKLIVKNKSR